MALRAALSPRPILLVEDDPKDAELIREALRAAGFPNSVVVCKDGTSAITLLGAIEHNEPCVVLVDLRLPGPSGFEVVEAMKADPVMRDVPVVIMTGSRRDEDVVRAYSLGANAYVVKPFGVSEFLELARELGGFWPVTHMPPRIYDGAAQPKLRPRPI